MSTLSSLSNLRHSVAALTRSAPVFVARTVLLDDANALLFSIKSFAAAMLAYYIALRIGLARPSWSIVTVYIVSQTSVGASLSRGVYRLAGTTIGAAATVAIVPNFVNSPVLCSIVLSAWIAFCLYFSLIDRTPRAYAFVLAGYTASLIGFPALSDPGAIFDTAIVRVQEVSIGILCATLIHRYVAPKRVTGLFNKKMSGMMSDARHSVAAALRGTPHQDSGAWRLAPTLQLLQGMGTHLPYDFANSLTRRTHRKMIHDRLARLVLVTAELTDHIGYLNAGGKNVPESLRILLVEVRNSLEGEDELLRRQSYPNLLSRSHGLKTDLTASALTIDDRIYVNLTRHLSEALEILHECDQLLRPEMREYPVAQSDEKPAPETAKGYVFHRDHMMAARSTFGAFLTIVTGCLVWIYSAWPDGATAISVLGVCCTLFSSFDTPAPHIVKYILGSFYGVLISLIYSFALLPQVTDFSELVAVLAPVFIFAGSLQARPPTTFLAMGITLTLPILCDLGSAYQGDFAASLNTSVALFTATAFSVITMSLLQTVQAQAAIRRLLTLSRHDARRKALRPAADETAWINLMADRTALLLTRLHGAAGSQNLAPFGILQSLRTGHVLNQLHRVHKQAADETRVSLQGLFSLMARYLENKNQTDTSLNIAMQKHIGDLMKLALSAADERAVALAGLLIDLRFALGLPEGGRNDDY